MRGRVDDDAAETFLLVFIIESLLIVSSSERDSADCCNCALLPRDEALRLAAVVFADAGEGDNCSTAGAMFCAVLSCCFGSRRPCLRDRDDRNAATAAAASTVSALRFRCGLLVVFCPDGLLPSDVGGELKSASKASSFVV